jgi:hypothetical protein
MLAVTGKVPWPWTAQENDEMRKVEEIPHPELDMLLARFYLGKETYNS